MAGPSWVHWLGVLLLLNSSAAQIFPFSNLRHIFKQEGKGGGGSKAPGSLGPPPTPEPSTTTTLEPPTTTGLAPYLAPYSLLDEDDGYREFQRPEYVVERPRPATRPTRVGHKAGAARPAQATLQPQATPVRTPPTKQKKRLPSHLVPVRIAYEPTTPASGDVHVLPSGDGQPMQPPPLYLIPPRLPADPADHANPSADYPDAMVSPTSPHAARTTETVVDTSTSASDAGPLLAPAPLPPVPAVYLRPPGPPTGPSKPVLFKLDLGDVASEALSHSTNPGILRPAQGLAQAPSSIANSIANSISNHKFASAPHNALLPAAQPKGKGGTKGLQQGHANHKDAFPKGGAAPNHRPEPNGDNPLVESSAAESSAAAAAVILEGPGHRTPGNHRPGARPLSSPTTPTPSRAPKFKNHKPAPPGQAPAPARPVKYHNHRPGSLDGEESMTSLRYRKRPLGPIEQEVAQTGLQHQGQYPHAGDGERVEFQMHGLKGPSSYKFGYDTGKGQNRQFRYEERDHHGNVKGHYGYVDEQGKLQVVNYKADPHGGYKADVSKLHT
ncbi:Cuticle Protein CPR RR Unclassified 15 [Frankliniella occidentalis]|uniref:Proline-rich protein 36-like isoform X1 n=1 Tax=Frankliniella occidentalis TaxID=133901 RepID=A0A9C6TX38_FRAOC|nr:proline-rich protein 36-like isoform X1 [Frankliniella occidentalis]KAE8746404.1 Cuticle Protein CPR RR Unclassified 15 [Frankliniella occidentalis]